MTVTCPSAKNGLPHKIGPLKIRFFHAGYQEISGALGELGEIHSVVFLALGIDVDGRL